MGNYIIPRICTNTFKDQNQKSFAENIYVSFHISFLLRINIKMLYMRGMKVYVPGKTLILSNFTGKNSDRIFRPGICIDIAHNIATKKDNKHIVSKCHNNSGINIIQKCFDIIMFTLIEYRLNMSTTWSISISEIRTYV